MSRTSTSLRHTTGAALGPQLHLNHGTPTAAAFLPPCFVLPPDRPAVLRRPSQAHGGLYTTPWRADGGSDFAVAMREYFPGYVARARWWRLRPDPTARVLVIDGPADLAALAQHYPAPAGVARPAEGVLVNFPALAVDGWDAVYLTVRGAALLADALPAWRCEQVYWLRWGFVGEAEEVGRPSVPPADPTLPPLPETLPGFVAMRLRAPWERAWCVFGPANPAHMSEHRARWEQLAAVVPQTPEAEAARSLALVRWWFDAHCSNTNLAEPGSTRPMAAGPGLWTRLLFRSWPSASARDGFVLALVQAVGEAGPQLAAGQAAAVPAVAALSGR